MLNTIKTKSHLNTVFPVFHHYRLHIRNLVIKIFPTIILVIYTQALFIIKSVIEFLATTTICYVYII